MPEENLVENLCSPDCRNEFRRSLRDVPSEAFIKRRGEKLILFIRPLNMLQFGQSVNRNGLQGCDRANAIIRHLDRNKNEFIRFEHVV
jgi:hypothetical protein